MAISWRVPLLLAVGAVAVGLWPRGVVAVAWVAVVLLACAVDLIAAASPRRIGLTRDVPPAVRLTETAQTTLTLMNTASGRTARLVVRDAWEPGAGAPERRVRVRIPGGQGRRLRTPLTPLRRGTRHAGPVTLRSFGPLGLAARQRTMSVPAEISVLPEFRSRRYLPYRLARLRELDGRASVRVRGQGTEFDSLREYEIGDDVRSIDWRATARGDKAVVRTWRPERDRRVVIVLDTSRWSAGRIGDATRLDAGIEAALLLGALAAAGGDRVDLVAADRVTRAHVGPCSGPTAVAALSAGLAGVEPVLVEADWTYLAARIRAVSRQRALVVLITSTDPALVEDGLATVLDGLVRRHVVLVATVRDPEEAELARGREDADAVYLAAAAERRELTLQGMEAQLRARGAHTVDGGLDTLAPAVADAYLTLKAAGQL
ncbi:MAG: DUF58 domain-containing protein [Bifidobacteriaceae bacterium]|jgi:uncharacterized protein (DUF58 family)|nr:DUF58 domain-containing protein [Bifidobacteriaceae bacterium]